MNEENTNAETEDNQLTTAESMAIAPKLPMPSTTPTPEYHPFVCKQCGKGFDSMNGVRMHNLRVHTPGGGRGYAWKKTRPKSREAQLALKRKYNKRMRDRYTAAGLTSTGKVRKREHKGGVPVGSKLPGWSPERRAKFLKTWRKRLNEKKRAAVSSNNHVPLPAPVNAVMFCPRCGCNMEVVRKAIEFADRQ